ncbi:Na+/H+ antiporter subunit E [Novosphingobium album (ex Liu et al. 2023)]|uniref:Na+/H+ antiporter subunit E n=1 Tax=Novosphingobium album (ex Liu et al. 2023) TaxID=3031130 RepID=A0ABT5WWJ5_9SPHN|nr:Na+/H+ antiporter subunit E [Novosphingobium album (ex Liu et al. 2023)]MDE8654242.1 Na+/H+ antiporter subunit E [Novosphingobium album (ex Liu et al. 2023)]
MTRLFPFPLMSAVLFAMWVLLTGFSPGHVVLAGLVALIVPRVMLVLDVEKPRIRIGWSMLKLVGLVLADIVRSNIAVARIVLFRPANRRSGFIRLPVELESRYALAVLAVIITATPGTLWLQHDARRHIILIHVLDLVDEDAWIALIKDRYERLLMDIFE